MAFQKKQGVRQIELSSLIDIVFLLLIFFLVSFSASFVGHPSQTKLYSEIELPSTNTKLPDIGNDHLENLMIQIMPDTVEGMVSRTIFVLWPSYEDSLQISRTQALMNAQHDSLFATFPPHFLDLSDTELASAQASTLLANSIEDYVLKERLYKRNTHPLIEVRADQNTEFKILNLIMQQCTLYKESVPQIIIRTLLKT